MTRRFSLGLYTLIGRLPVPCDDPDTWGRFMESCDRHVAETFVGPLRISTVFLGLDHSFGFEDTAVLFETMIFGTLDETYQTRCQTWDEAETMHRAAVVIATEMVRVGDLLITTFRRMYEERKA